MARDMVCKNCETSGEPEVGIMLISDLTGSGQLPIAIGQRCMPIWLHQMEMIFGIWDEHAEMVAYQPGSPGAVAAGETAEANVEVDESHDEPLAEVFGEPPEAVTEAAQELLDAIDQPVAAEGPTAQPARSGRSPRTTTAPAAGNGKRSRAKPKPAPTAQTA